MKYVVFLMLLGVFFIVLTPIFFIKFNTEGVDNIIEGLKKVCGVEP